MLMKRTTTGGIERGSSGKGSAPALLALRQAQQGEPPRTQPSISRRPRNNAEADCRRAQVVQLQPSALGIGHAQLLEPEIERDQAIQAGQADGRIGAAQGAAQQLGDQPFTGRGLGDRECARKREGDQAQRPHQHEADAADHVRGGEVQRPLSAAAVLFGATT